MQKYRKFDLKKIWGGPPLNGAEPQLIGSEPQFFFIGHVSSFHV